MIVQKGANVSHRKSHDEFSNWDSTTKIGLREPASFRLLHCSRGNHSLFRREKELCKSVPTRMGQASHLLTDQLVRSENYRNLCPGRLTLKPNHASQVKKKSWLL